MTENSILARDYTFELDPTGEGDWVEIEEINTWTPAPVGNDADVTTFSDQGHLAHLKASRGLGITLAGIQGYDIVTHERAAGQVAVEAWGALMGPDSVKPFRITDPYGSTKTFNATALVTSGGGGNDAPSAWTVVVTRSGATAEDTLPAVPATPTSPAGTTANASSVVSFTTSTGTPTLFEVVIYAGSTEITRVQSTANPVYVPGLTNGVAYTAKVRARNAGGWSALSAASSAFTPAS